ncbi:helix-turn-helix domain-containing protein [Methyloradius palustris]|uniref:Transcriptional regulator n=1 Tax=Methyloradius palustris TaxID=2778876 RepID=A0A8D5FZK0_9PROT|nr:helix-turn-helix transcriptional regulator [Methyloradius palustris]BCM25159.1 transcriptional regulator [Methyloradius palustris]
MNTLEEAALAKKIGQIISTKREKLGMTQGQLAEKLNIGYEAVSRIERGKIIPSVTKLYDLASIFNCKVSDFLDAASHRSTDQAEYIAGLLSNLSEADRKMIVEVVETIASRLTN